MPFRRAPAATAAVLMVGGIGGGFDSPAAGLYDRPAAELPRASVCILRARFRRPGHIDSATTDGTPVRNRIAEADMPLDVYT